MEIIISVLAEIPSNILGWFIIEKKFFGRRRSIFLGFLFCGFISILCYKADTNESMFIFGSSLLRFVYNLIFNLIYPYTTELYPTKIRITGLGMASGLCRIGGMIMPWLLMLFTKFGITGPFIMFAICSFLGFLSIYNIPYET